MGDATNEDGSSTRSALHAVAEHVLAPALHVSTGHIGLRVMRGGFGTPVFRSPHGNRQVQVDGLDLVVTDDRGRRRAPLTTIAEAAAFVGVTPGAPKGLYPPSTTLELDRPLRPEPEAAATLATWFALVDAALADLAAIAAVDAPEPVQLWPEHFDVATTIAGVNYGGSPGDGGHDQPYAYVGPHDLPAAGGFWNEPFGASLPAAAVGDRHDVLAFFVEGRRRVQGSRS